MFLDDCGGDGELEKLVRTDQTYLLRRNHTYLVFIIKVWGFEPRGKLLNAIIINEQKRNRRENFGKDKFSA